MILALADLWLLVCQLVDLLLSVIWWWGPLAGAAIVAWAFRALQPTGRRRRPRTGRRVVRDNDERVVAVDLADGTD
ncbi:hypothetical protein ABZT26_03100 [Streptomyces sp. NPDC005395]|uniref:hypothetical protein n=1 Tax=Streptomyces sp. NPDC005395 TaxID=3157042 RepID=UPI0033B6EE92